MKAKRPDFLCAVSVSAALALALASRAAAAPQGPPSAASSQPIEASSPAAPPDPLPLAWCLERARAENPEIRIDLATAQAARHRIVPAGALDDPRVGYRATNVPVSRFDFDSTPMSGHQLSAFQKVPYPGLLASREAAARSGAEAADALLADRRVRVDAAVEQAWSELGFAQRALEVTERNIEIVRQLARIAEAKYRVGTGLQSDVLRAQVTLTRLLDERLQRRAAVREAEATLAAWLDLPPEVHFPRTREIREPAPLPQLEPLLAQLEERSPRLRALAARIAEAERLRRAAVLEGRPDFDFGLGYRIRERAVADPVSGDDFFFAGVTIRLPINRKKWRERVAERDALWRRARAAYARERARLREEARVRFAELERADRTERLLETGLVPQARQSLESDRAGYEVDKVDFLSLMDAEVRLLDAELGLVRAQADRRQAYAALEAAVGEDLR